MKFNFPIVLVLISPGGCIIPESNHGTEYHLLVSLSSDDNETLYHQMFFHVREVSASPYLDDSRFARRQNTSSLLMKKTIGGANH